MCYHKTDIHCWKIKPHTYVWNNAYSLIWKSPFQNITRPRYFVWVIIKIKIWCCHFTDNTIWIFQCKRDVSFQHTDRFNLVILFSQHVDPRYTDKTASPPRYRYNRIHIIRNKTVYYFQWTHDVAFQRAATIGVPSGSDKYQDSICRDM